MSLIQSIASWYLKKRMYQIEFFKNHPIETQEEVFYKLVKRASKTAFGNQHKFSSIGSMQQFRERVPVFTYEKIFPWIERSMMGEKNVLWPGGVSWFSKSSGTTNDRSKYIPVTKDSLQETHFKCGKDMLAIYFNNFPLSKGFGGKALSVGGSQEINPLNPGSWCGDLSAILIQNLPLFYEMFRSPEKKIALLGNWERKIDEMAASAIREDITTLVGVPTWTSLLLKKSLEISGKAKISQLWPGLEVFFHGGLNFEPYRQQFDELIGRGMNYWETYNASEGFFALQDAPGRKDLLLMLDCGIFYEFIPTEELGNDFPKAVLLEDVKIGKNYAMLISTNGGLWRYLIGDTVRFTTTFPFRIQISGRTRQFINAFGEELMVDNAEVALANALRESNASIADYIVAPLFYPNGTGAHEWLIEFNRKPESLETFTIVLDAQLRKINSDYDAKRSADLVMKMPVISILPQGTFYEWLKSKNRLGGQNKVPRLSNDRSLMDEFKKRFDFSQTQ